MHEFWGYRAFRLQVINILRSNGKMVIQRYDFQKCVKALARLKTRGSGMQRKDTKITAGGLSEQEGSG